jgi:hypothetical protein
MRQITLYYNSNYKSSAVTLYTIHDENLKEPHEINKIFDSLQKMKLLSNQYKKQNRYLGFMNNISQVYTDDVVIARFKI